MVIKRFKGIVIYVENGDTKSRHAGMLATVVAMMPRVFSDTQPSPRRGVARVKEAAQVVAGDIGFLVPHS